jgi:hypothetical protein
MILSKVKIVRTVEDDTETAESDDREGEETKTQHDTLYDLGIPELVQSGFAAAATSSDM